VLDVGQQAQRGRVPARRERGGAGGTRRARLGEHRDRLRVADGGGALDVRRSCRRCRAAPRQQRGDARVRTGAPAAGGKLVDRRADDRMAEGVLAGRVGRVDELEAQKLVDQLKRVGVADIGGAGRQQALKRIAGHRRPLQEDARRRRQRRQLARERRSHRLGDGIAEPRSDVGERDAARELRQEERVAAALSVEQVALRAGNAVCDHRAGGVGAQRRKVQPQGRSVAHRGSQRDGEPRGDLRGAKAERPEDRAARRVRDEVADQLD